MSLIILLCVVNVLISSINGGDCPANSSYTKCAYCPNTCSNMYVLHVCPQSCLPGCICNPGYVSNNNGTCVLPANCPPEEVSCPNDLVFNPCGSCQTTCETIGEAECPPVCNSGCFCRDGLVYDNATTRCVKREQCQNYLNNECKKKDANSVYSNCGSCEKSCDNLNPICTANCRTGCFCAEGFVLHKGKCILQCRCPKT